MTPNNESMRAAIYCRVSTDRQRREATIETQSEANRRYCDHHGLQVVAEYRDDGLSGTVEFNQRPGGRKLLSAAQAGLFEAVVVYDTSRLGRDDYAVITPLTVAYLRSLGMEIHTPNGPLQDTPEGNLMLGIHASLDAFYRADFARKTRDGKRRAVREGRWMGHNIAYGYRVEEGRYTPNREPTAAGLSPADVVTLIFRLVADEGSSCRDIARRLNSLGVPTPLGHRAASPARWLDSTVARFLHRPIYLGTMVAHIGRERYEVPVEPLVDRDTWERAQAQLQENRTRAAEGRQHVYTVARVLYCGRCGQKYHTQSCTPAGRQYCYYRCYGRTEGKGCDAPAVRSDHVEPSVWADILHVAGHPEALAERVAAHVIPTDDRGDDLAAQREQLLAILAAKPNQTDAILGLFRAGRIRQDALERQLAQIDAEEAALREQIAALTARLEAASRSADALRKLSETIAGLRALLSPDAAPETQRDVINRLVRRVTVRKDGTLHIEYRFKF